MAAHYITESYPQHNITMGDITFAIFYHLEAISSSACTQGEGTAQDVPPCGSICTFAGVFVLRSDIEDKA